MFQDSVRFPVIVSISEDPAADQTYPVWRAPLAAEVRGAYATVVDDVASSTANYFTVQLLNGGAAGTATTTMTDAIGGTPGWTGLTPKTFALTAAQVQLAAGEVVTLKYDETGTGTFKQITVQLDVVYGEATL